MSIELAIILKDDERTLRRDYLAYEPVTMSLTDAMVSKCLDEVKSEFSGTPTDIRIRATMVVR